MSQIYFKEYGPIMRITKKKSKAATKKQQKFSSNAQQCSPASPAPLDVTHTLNHGGRASVFHRQVSAVGPVTMTGTEACNPTMNKNVSEDGRWCPVDLNHDQ